MIEESVGVRTITVFQEKISDKNFLEDLEYIKKELSFIKSRNVRLGSVSKELIEKYNVLDDDEIWGVSKSIVLKRLNEEKYINKVVSDIEKNKKVFYSLNVDTSKDLASEDLFNITNLIRRVSKTRDMSGYSNFQLGVGFNIEEYTPYFPFAFSNPEKQNDCVSSKFSVGLEIINLIKTLLLENSRKSFEKISEILESSLEEKILNLQKQIMSRLKSSPRNIDFIGFDISLAPFPYLHGEASVVELIEILANLGRSRSKIKFIFGDPGTQFIHTFFTNLLKKIKDNPKIKTVGFCSLMYSVLEDNLLADYFSSNRIDFRNLLLLSTTCGCGLDMIPLNKNVKDEEILGYILDTFCLSDKLQKPLGLRLLIDNNRAGDEITDYEDIYFTNLKLQQASNGPHFLKLPQQIKNKINFL